MDGCPEKSHLLDPARSAEAYVLIRILQGIRYEMFPGKREAREGRREQERRCPRKLHESLREPRRLREGLREGPL